MKDLPKIKPSIPKDHPYQKVKFVYYEGHYFYNQIPCIETDEKPEGKIIEVIGDRVGSYYVYENDIISGKSISGKVLIKIWR